MNACIRCKCLIPPAGKTDAWNRNYCQCDEPLTEDRRKEPSVPAGFVPVPVEPTDEMKYVGRVALRRHDSTRDVWDAMVGMAIRQSKKESQ